MRIYNLDPDLTPEQTAVTFAMTSRSPKPFDEIAKEVSETRAADFHEKWVVGYGHSSVAEHAVLHVAIEGISRLACDAVEEGRLASYTEKSSRYQMIRDGDWYTPLEVSGHSFELRTQYTATMGRLFTDYREATSQLEDAILQPRAELYGGEYPETGIARRSVRRRVIDQTRSLLPAATLTNVGMTANARTMEHTISKLLSDPLEECRAVGQRLKETALERVPTLLKYADANESLIQQRQYLPRIPTAGETCPAPHSSAVLLDRDDNPLARVGFGSGFYGHDDRKKTGQNVPQYLLDAFRPFFQPQNPHDSLPRALELVNYLFSVTLDYGALREFRRHRIGITPISQRLTVVHGYEVPPLFEEYGLADRFHEAMDASSRLYHAINDALGPAVAQYAVTHAHQQQILVQVNLRELVELARLRTSKRAHASIRKPVQAMVDEVRKVHPELWELVEVKEKEE